MKASSVGGAQALRTVLPIARAESATFPLDRGRGKNGFASQIVWRDAAKYANCQIMPTPSKNLDTSQLAKLCDTSPRWIQKLTTDGVLNRARDADGAELRGRYNLLAIRDYCRYLKTLAHLDDASEARHLALKNEKLAAETEMAHMNLLSAKGSCTMHATWSSS
jgi:hypothetical protein